MSVPVMDEADAVRADVAKALARAEEALAMVRRLANVRGRWPCPPPWLLADARNLVERWDKEDGK